LRGPLSTRAFLISELACGQRDPLSIADFINIYKSELN